MGSKSGEVTCTEHGKPIGLLISQEKVSLSQERPNGLYRTLSSLRCIPSATRQSSGFASFIYYAAIGACEAAGCLISFNSFCES